MSHPISRCNGNKYIYLNIFMPPIINKFNNTEKLKINNYYKYVYLNIIYYTFEEHWS